MRLQCVALDLPCFIAFVPDLGGTTYDTMSAESMELVFGRSPRGAESVMGW